MKTRTALAIGGLMAGLTTALAAPAAEAATPAAPSALSAVTAKEYRCQRIVKRFDAEGFGCTPNERPTGSFVMHGPHRSFECATGALAGPGHIVGVECFQIR